MPRESELLVDPIEPVDASTWPAIAAIASSSVLSPDDRQTIARACALLGKVSDRERPER